MLLCSMFKLLIYKQSQIIELGSCRQNPKEENVIVGKWVVWLRGQTDKLIFLKDIAVHPPKKTYFSQQFGKSRIERSLKKKDFSELKFVLSRLWSLGIQSHASLLSWGDPVPNRYIYKAWTTCALLSTHLHTLIIYSSSRNTQVKKVYSKIDAHTNRY